MLRKGRLGMDPRRRACLGDGEELRRRAAGCGWSKSRRSLAPQGGHGDHERWLGGRRWGAVIPIRDGTGSSKDERRRGGGTAAL